MEGLSPVIGSYCWEQGVKWGDGGVSYHSFFLILPYAWCHSSKGRLQGNCVVFCWLLVWITSVLLTRFVGVSQFLRSETKEIRSPNSLCSIMTVPIHAAIHPYIRQAVLSERYEEKFNLLLISSPENCSLGNLIIVQFLRKLLAFDRARSLTTIFASCRQWTLFKAIRIHFRRYLFQIYLNIIIPCTSASSKQEK